MLASFKPSRLCGNIDAPPSKSMAHRFLIASAISGQECVLTGIEYSEDILASIDCLRALGAKISIEESTAVIERGSFMRENFVTLPCRESGSTLRFFIPLALTAEKEIRLTGSARLLERPLGVYEELCACNGFAFNKDDSGITLKGSLKSGNYKLRGDVSSQFISGMLFALVYLNIESSIEIIPPFESRSYIDLTISALKAFGADVEFEGERFIRIKPSTLNSYIGRIEGDYSNAAFLDAFNHIGSSVNVGNLKPDSLQGDRVYKTLFALIENGTPEIDISDCPDLAPILFALAAMKNGATFIGTDRLKVKESDRGLAMHAELLKLGIGLQFGDNEITVPKQELKYKGIALDGHNDHRIVMACSVILSKIGGEIYGAEAVKKSYPSFFTDIKRLGAEVELL